MNSLLIKLRFKLEKPYFINSEKNIKTCTILTLVIHTYAMPCNIGLPSPSLGYYGSFLVIILCRWDHDYGLPTKSVLLYSNVLVKHKIKITIIGAETI